MSWKIFRRKARKAEQAELRRRMRCAVLMRRAELTARPTGVDFLIWERELSGSPERG